MMFDRNTLGEQFARTAEDVNSFSSSLLPGAPNFARHMLQAQLEVLKGMASLVHGQLASIDRQFPASAPAAAAAHKTATAEHGPERVRVAVADEEEEPVTHPPRKRTK